jgi:type I restriction enzyme S subunit
LDIDEVPVDPAVTYQISGVYGFGRGLFGRGPIQGSGTSYSKFNRLRAGKLVMSRLKAFEGALAVIPEKFDGWYLSQEFPTFRVDKSRASVRYIANLCAWPQFWERLSAESKGLGAQKERVSADRLLSIKVPLPDLPEQRRIAARLDSVLSEIKQVDDLRVRRARLLAAHQESLVSTTSAGAGSDELGKLLRAVRPPVDIDESAKYRALGMRSFGKGTIRYPEAAGSELSKLRYFSFPANALALSNIKAWEGAIDVTSVEDLACVASNRFLFYIAADDRINIRYLRYYLLSKQGLAQISACSPGSADRNRTLSIKSFERIRVPLPSRPEQDRVAELLDSLSEHLDPVRTDTVVKSLRPSLLNAAFSGQL